MQRTGRQRLEEIPAAIHRGEEFHDRLIDADGDAARCADLMAEAIAMHREAMALETVGMNGKSTFSAEEVVASHCMQDSRIAYLKARGSNQK